MKSVVVICVLLSVPVFAQQGQTNIQLKVGYIINFSKYIVWPSSSSTFVIGVLGKDAISETLEKKVQNVSTSKCMWVVKYCTTIQEAKGCNMLYVSSTKMNYFLAKQAHIKGKPILTITDGVSDFCKKGGIINLNLPNNSFPFDINPTVAECIGLKVNVELFRIANVVSSPKATYPCSN